MSLEKLEKIAKLVLKELSPYEWFAEIQSYHNLEAEFKNLMVLASKILPDYKELFAVAHGAITEEYSALEVHEATSLIKHLLMIIEIEKASEEKIKEMKIFESAEEKLKQAALSFRKEDYPSVFHNLNTALELVLKDKVGIPTTITKINTSKIIDVLVKHKVEPYLYLAEAKKRIVMIDNKIKHQGYLPSKIDCIHGIKAMEEVISKLRTKEIELTKEIRNKIYEGL